jgi:phosphate acetyltransferase
MWTQARSRHVVVDQYNLECLTRRLSPHLSEARQLINTGRTRDFENILNKYKALEAEYDFVLCEGTDFQGQNPAFEFEINADIAANLGAPVLLVASGRGKGEKEVLDSTQLIIEALEEKGLDLVACVVNRVEGPAAASIAQGATA